MSVSRIYRRLATHGPEDLAGRLLFLFLLPFSGLFALIVTLRKALYDHNLLPVWQAPRPVISVGNLAVGGTGKTPIVDALVKTLLAAGRRPAVVSRGYGGSRSRDGLLVSHGDNSGPLVSAEACGDEPFLIARRNPKAIVAVAPRRRTAIELALDCGADIVLLDDAFSHRAVARDLDIVLLDEARPFGNGRYLPAGLLREGKDSLKRAGAVLLTRAAAGQPRPDLPIAGRCFYRLDTTLIRLDSCAVSLRDLDGRRAFAFAGIAEPDPFFSALRGLGLALTGTMAFDDHQHYGPAELDCLREAAEDADFFVTTEKDGVKLRPEFFDKPCYQIVLTLDTEPATLLHELIAPLLCKDRIA